MLKLKVPNIGIRLKTNSRFENLELNFEAGIFTILLGPNGGGKSTILKSLLSPKEAGVSLLNDRIDLAEIPPLERSRIVSYVGTSGGQRPRLSVMEFLKLSFYLRAELCSVDKIEIILESLEVSHLIESRIDELSEGEYKRIHIAGGLLQGVQWYVLDEPEEHLDPVALMSLAKTIVEMKKVGKSFIIACHDLNLANYLGDQFIGIRSSGEIAFVKSKIDVLEHRLLDDLFSCKLDYHSVPSKSGASYVSSIGPKYE